MFHYLYYSVTMNLMKNLELLFADFQQQKTFLHHYPIKAIC